MTRRTFLKAFAAAVALAAVPVEISQLVKPATDLEQAVVYRYLGCTSCGARVFRIDDSSPFQPATGEIVTAQMIFNLDGSRPQTGDRINHPEPHCNRAVAILGFVP